MLAESNVIAGVIRFLMLLGSVDGGQRWIEFRVVGRNYFG